MPISFEIVRNFVQHTKTYLSNFKKSPFSISFIDQKILKILPKGKLRYRKLLKKKIYFNDGYGYLVSINEIFVQECYKFQSESESPYIIDCGANIGVSVIYFKTFYPGATIIAFEPDSENFSLLQNNISTYNLKNVILENKAVWINNQPVLFNNDNSQSSKIANPSIANTFTTTHVESARLKDLLNCNVDLLKIDIEGAEFEVLQDCGESLINVKNLFVEYHSFKEQPQKLDELLMILKKNGFRYYIESAFKNKESGFLSLTNPRTDMDLQLNIYARRFDH